MFITKLFDVASTASLAICLVLALASCSSPPKPPSVDDSTKRPVNTKAAVDLQSCRGELSRFTILLDELARSNALSTALVSTRVPQACAPDVAGGLGAATSKEPAGSNRISIIEYTLGSASWAIDKVDEDALAQKASTSALIVIRGRTDAVGDSAGETALARRRAESAAEFLRTRGIPAERLRVTWQGAGDSRPQTPAGRAQNRRVELEFYMAPPATLVVRSNVRPDAL
jgi:outer membrane protein OmpA-like peptidoglycan-associated protein